MPILFEYDGFRRTRVGEVLERWTAHLLDRKSMVRAALAGCLSADPSLEVCNCIRDVLLSTPQK
jgi:hypothetical protein